MLFSDIFVLIVDYIDENMIETANNDTLDSFDYDEHNYDDKSLPNINYASLLCLRFSMILLTFLAVCSRICLLYIILKRKHSKDA